MPVKTRLLALPRLPARPAGLAVVLLAMLAAGAALAQTPPPPAPQAAPRAYDRPQTPKEPFPYGSQSIALAAPDGAHLAGTLTVPPGKGPFAAVLLINGSGPVDRDETIAGHKPFLVLADALTRRGVVVLRMDKRGVGASTGASRDLTTADYAKDARAALAWLRHRPEVDPARVGLLGHSEGGEIAPMVAAADPSAVAFIVLLAAPGLPGDTLLLSQSRAILEAVGASPQEIESAARANREIYDIAMSDLPAEDAEPRVEAVLTQAGVPAAAVETMARQGLSPWVRWFLRHDPRPDLAKIRCPILVLNGAKDVQVVAARNLPEIRAALAANPRATVTELPGLNHLFQTATTGAPREYGAITETFAPSALALIVDWVARTEGVAP